MNALEKRILQIPDKPFANHKRPDHSGLKNRSDNSSDVITGEISGESSVRINKENSIADSFVNGKRKNGIDFISSVSKKRQKLNHSSSGKMNHVSSQPSTKTYAGDNSPSKNVAANSDSMSFSGSSSVSGLKKILSSPRIRASGSNDLKPKRRYRSSNELEVSSPSKFSLSSPLSASSVSQQDGVENINSQASWASSCTKLFSAAERITIPAVKFSGSQSSPHW